MSAQALLAKFNVTLEQAHDWVMANVENPDTIFSVAVDFGITSSMLAEIVAPSIPSATAAMVEQFFISNGKNPTLLNNISVGTTGYVDSAEHAFDDGYNNGYLQGFLEHLKPETDIGLIFNSNEMPALFPQAYSDGFQLGLGDGYKDADYTEYFAASPQDPAPTQPLDLASLAEASGYLDGYKDGLAEYFFAGFGFVTDYDSYDPENITGYLAPYNQGFEAGRADGVVMNEYDHFYYDTDQVNHLAYLFV